MAAKKKARSARKKAGGRAAPGQKTRQSADNARGRGPATSARKGRGRSGAASTRSTSAAKNGDPQEPQLRDLFAMELADFIGGEQQVLRLLEMMENAATIDRLQQTLEMARDDVEHHVRFATRMLDRLDGAAAGEGNATLQGLVNGVEQRVEQMGRSPARDLALITALQKATHLDMASLGTLAAWARELNARDMVERLEDMLNDKKLADRHLTRIAVDCLEQDEVRSNGLVGSRG